VSGAEEALGVGLALSAGPVGWALLAFVAVGVTAVVVYEAEKDADTTVPDTATDTTEDCKKTCATEHPELELCAELPSSYIYPSQAAAFQAVKTMFPGRTLRMEKTRPATGGPCPETGSHTAVKDGGTYMASIVCCPCCTDTASGPVQSTRCAIV